MRMFEKLTVGVACAGLVLASLSCRGSQTRPAKDASSSRSTLATWTSPRFGYKWTLSDEWEFYPMNEIARAPKKLAFDAVGARKKGMKRPSAFLQVWRPPRPEPGVPRVLHLREPRFGLEFDAPDDSWLATGPYVGGGGAQLVWMWRHADRGVDVQVMDFRDLPTEPTEERLLELHRESFAKKGSKVVVGTAFLGGEPCHHLKVSGSDGWYRDVFFLHRNSINYTVLISQRKRDPKLIARVTKAIRFTLLEQERERQEARLAP
jgi:hypothetical protein